MKVPDTIIRLVKADYLLVSEKTRSQLKTGPFCLDDLIHSILHGKVVKKERDEQKKARYKYTIIGPAMSGRLLYSCGKIVQQREKMYFVITFHKAD